MTYNPNHDRTYWRATSTRTLIEAARDSGHELAIALGERLEELEDCAEQLADAIAEVRELDQRCDALRDELQAFYDAEAGA
jgi:predicted trehalose synthase